MATNPSRSWCFTWNNPPPGALDTLLTHRAGSSAAPVFTMLAVGFEVGASGTPHYQGTFTTSKPVRLSALTRALPGLHFEIRRATEEQAIAYTKKDGSPDRLDFDDRSQGARNDIHSMSAMVAADPRSAIRNVATAMPELYIKFHAGVAALSRALLPQPPLRQAKNVRWFCGPSGTGKTYNAVAEATALAPESDIFVWALHNLKFAGNYSGQRFVIIDELRPTWEHFTFARLLTLLGDLRTEVEVKGGQVTWCATDIWITTPFSPYGFLTPEESRANPQAHVQLTRRINETRVYEDVHPDAFARPVCPATPPQSRSPSPATLPFTFAPPLELGICPDSDDDFPVVLRA